jgi:hypothetical protein
MAWCFRNGVDIGQRRECVLFSALRWPAFGAYPSRLWSWALTSVAGVNVPGYSCTSPHTHWWHGSWLNKETNLYAVGPCLLKPFSAIPVLQYSASSKVTSWHKIWGVDAALLLWNLFVGVGWWHRSYPSLQELVKVHWLADWSQQSVDQNIFLLAADCKLYYREVSIQIYALVIFWPWYERRVSCHTAKLELNWRV